MDTVEDKVMQDLWIKEYRRGRFTGETLRDQLILRDICGKLYFSEMEYDNVLKLVSEYGFCLAIKIES